jgi:hypothetical protein
VSERIDAQDLPEGQAQVLRDVEWVAAVAAVAEADIEQPELGAARRGPAVEADLATVVIGERLRGAEQLPRRLAERRIAPWLQQSSRAIDLNRPGGSVNRPYLYRRSLFRQLHCTLEFRRFFFDAEIVGVEFFDFRHGVPLELNIELTI